MRKHMFWKIQTLLMLVLCGSCTWIPIVNSSDGKVFRVKVEATEPNDKKIAEQAAVVLMNRLDANGFTSETKVSSESGNILNVKVFGETDSRTIRKILSAGSDLSFAKVLSPPNPIPVKFYPTKEAARESAKNLDSTAYRVLESTERLSSHSEDQVAIRRWIVIENPPIIRGDGLRNASAISVDNKNYQIAFSLKPDSAKTFGEWTGKNISNYMAVVLNGKVQSIAFIRSQIFDQGQIDGHFTKEQAEDLAVILKSGYLPAKLTVIEEKRFESPE